MTVLGNRSFVEVIEITPDEVSRLNSVNVKREAVAAFVQQVTTAGERRAAEVIQEGQALWQELAKKYGLDLEHVMYVVEDGKLVAKQVRA